MADEVEKDSGSTRRAFMARATMALGGIVGLITAIPLVRYFWHPVGRRVVRSAAEPIDVLAVGDLPKDGTPVKVEIRADGVRDAWGVADNVPLGSAWLRKQGDQVSCFSAVCPHLGCAVGYDPKQQQYRCPCHKSSFDLDGDKNSGPSKRGLDPLPVEEKNGRLRVTWKRFKADIADREEV
jgi:Rieske Fe-S protein